MKNKGKILLVLLLVAAIVIIAGCAWFYFNNRTRACNVILISIDTCRADHLSCYGYPKPTTPNLDLLAKEASLYTNAYTTIPLTLPAHSSILTGTYPPFHGVHDNLNQRLSLSNVTLPEILKEYNFFTGGIVSTAVLDKKFGISQGFDSYNDQFVNAVGPAGSFERHGNEATDFAIQFIEQRKDNPFFLFLHYYDPHTDYNPPAPFDGMFPDDPYSGEIAFTDHCISLFIDTLKKHKLYDSALIIVLGDHGEGLSEHGETEHGYFLYQNTMRIPLIVKFPHQAKPRIINNIVSHVDVMPTILSNLNIPIPAHMQGRDLSAVAPDSDDPTKEHHIFCEALTPTKYGCNPLLGLISEKWKYIDTTNPELYNVQKDPLESENLLNIETSRARLMRAMLQELTLQITQSAKTDNQVALDKESRKRLESLGYVGGNSLDTTLSMDPKKPNPKERIAFHEYVQKFTHLTYWKRFDEALEVCKKMETQWSAMPDSYLHSGTVFYEMADYEKAITYLSRYLEMASQQEHQFPKGPAFDPDNPVTKARNLLGSSYFNLKQFDKALDQYLTLIKIKDDVPDFYNGLAAVYFKLDKFDLAIENWQTSINLDPTAPEVYNNLATAYYKIDNYDKAIECWTQALDLRPDWQEVSDNLKKITAKNQARNAVNQYMTSLKQNPDDIDAHNNLAHIYYQQGETDKAIEHWKESARLKPDDSSVHNLLATAFYKQGNIKDAVSHWTVALEIKPDWPDVLNNLAWVLAATKDDSIRDSQKALTYAIKACELSDYKKSDILDTLGVVYAAIGNFDEAIKSADNAVKLADEEKNNILADDIRKRLQLYQAHKPYIE